MLKCCAGTMLLVFFARLIVCVLYLSLCSQTDDKRHTLWIRLHWGYYHCYLRLQMPAGCVSACVFFFTLLFSSDFGIPWVVCGCSNIFLRRLFRGASWWTGSMDWCICEYLLTGAWSYCVSCHEKSPTVGLERSVEAINEQEQFKLIHRWHGFHTYEVVLWS